MKYTLTLEARGGNVKVGAITGKSQVTLDFPVEAHFTSHNSVATALATLVPILLGEALIKYDAVANPEDANPEDPENGGE